MTDTPPRAGTAARVAWALYDWANSAFVTVIQTFVFAAYFIRSVAADVTAGTTQWGVTLSVASLVAAVAGPVLGAVVDQGGRRKPWLFVFTALCVAASGLLWLVRPEAAYAWPAMWLVGAGMLAYHLAAVPYNAMLPDLAPADRLGRWSGWGWGLGYAGGLACLFVAQQVFLSGAWPGLDPVAAEDVRATFLLAAVWYGVFALPLFVLAPDVPGTEKPLGRMAIDGLRQLGTSLRRVWRDRRIVRFLVAQMLYVDGLATVFAFSGVFAAGTFGLSAAEIVTLGIGLNVASGAGSVAFAWLDDRLGSRRVILIALVGVTVPLLALLLVTGTGWFWGLGLAAGLFVGPVQASSRAFMARLAPVELRNELFGLYAFSGKATAFAGPLLVALITDWTGSQRAGLGVIIPLLIGGWLVLRGVPEERPRE